MKPKRKQLSKQQIFNRVSKHLLKQGRRSILPPTSPRVGCAYRGVDGTKCAVGCLIADRDYSPDFEGKSILRVELANTSVILAKLRKALAKAGVLNSLPLLVDLQDLHDTRLVDEWPAALSRLASAHNLVFKPK